MSEKEAKKGRLYIGPAGWSYRDWEGVVYPPASKEDRLLYISRYCNCIELNSSFYKMPSAHLVRDWADRLSCADDFLLNVKVLGTYTHQRRIDGPALNQFIERFDPLVEKGIFGSFLIQFPWSFRFTRENIDYLDQLTSFFTDRPTAVEVRHGSWGCREAETFLSDRSLIWCNIDQPVIGESLPPSSRVTSRESAYIRLHGRNFKDWFRKGAGRDARYDYLYGEDEMSEWQGMASDMLNRSNRLFIITNNHFQGQALVNAFQIKSMISGGPVDVPRTLRRAYPILEKYSNDTPEDGELF